MNTQIVEPIKGFDEWMYAVDRFCEHIAGLSVYDLSDQCYRDWYDRGMKAATAARQAIRADGG